MTGAPSVERSRPAVPAGALLILLAGYLAVGIVSGLHNYLVFSPTPGLAALVTLVGLQTLNALPWVPVTLLVVRETRRTRAAHHLSAQLAWHALFGVAMVGSVNLLQVLVRWSVGQPFAPGEGLLGEFAVGLARWGPFGLLWYGLLVMGTLAWGRCARPAPQRVAAPSDGTVDCPSARLEVQSGSSHRLVDVGDIEWIEARGDYVRLHTGAGSYLKLARMKQLETTLDASRFARAHRSAIVNLDHVESFSPVRRGDYLLRLKSGATVRVARSRREYVLRLLRTR